MIQNTTLGAWSLPSCLFPVLLFYLLMCLTDNINHLALYNESYLFPSNLEENKFRTTAMEAIWEMPAASPVSGLSPRGSLLCPWAPSAPPQPAAVWPQLKWAQPWGVSGTQELELCLPNLPARLGMPLFPLAGNSQSLPTLELRLPALLGTAEPCSPWNGSDTTSNHAWFR